MHVGNLRSALYEFLIAKHAGGDFMLRIEDTDQERYVEGATEIIYRTLEKTGLVHDEGPDKDGGYGPYVQSERMKTGIYMKYAKELIDKGEAYYCFCDKERLASLKTEVVDGKEITVYDKHCLSLSKEEIEALTAEHEAAPHLRVLQKRLAKEVTIMVHSEEDYNAAVDASNILFGNATSEALKKLDEDTLLAVFEGVPQFEVSRDALAAGVKAVDLFVDNAAVFASKGEMRKLVQGGGVSLNKEKLAAFDQVVTTADLLDDKYLLVQRGKKNYYLIIAK